jgi:hypothetical protein
VGNNDVNKKSFFKVVDWMDVLKIVCVFVAILTVFVIITASAISTKDVFSGDFNGMEYDFDIEDYNSSADAVNKSALTLEEKGGVDGSPCLVINSNAPNDARFVRDIYLQARRHYRVTGYVKVSDISGDEAVGASIQIHKVSKSTGKTDEKIPVDNIKYVTGDSGWTRVQFDIPETAMGNTYRLALRLGDNGALTAGKAYFDNITVRMVSPLDAGTFEDVRFLSCLLTVGLLFVFFVAYRYARRYEKTGGKGITECPSGGEINILTAAVVIFTIAFLLRLFLSVTYFQCDIDVNLFKSWGDNAVYGGFHKIYENLGDNIDYPPVVVYFLAFASLLDNALGVPLFGLDHEYFHTVLVKLPSILSDIAIGYIILKYAKKMGASKEWSLFAAALWLFNPLSLIDAACWGQVDSMLALVVILSIIYLNKKNFLVAGIMFGLGVVLKPQIFFFLPVFGYIWLKDTIVFKKALRAVKNFFLSIGGALIGVFVPCIPFLHMGFKNVELLGVELKLPWIFSLLVGTANHYEFTSVNCYNFWFLTGYNWVSDDTTLLKLAETAEHPNQMLITLLSNIFIGNISLFSIGISFIVIISLLTLIFAVMLKDGEYLPYLLSGFMFAAVPFFAPRMHERYFFVADVLSFILFLAAKKLWYVPLINIFASFVAYAYYLFYGVTLINYIYVAFALLVIIILVIKDLYKYLSTSSSVGKEGQNG